MAETDSSGLLVPDGVCSSLVCFSQQGVFLFGDIASLGSLRLLVSQVRPSFFNPGECPALLSGPYDLRD